MKQYRNYLTKRAKKTRERRSAFFLKHFKLDQQTRILDLGGHSGEHIHSILENTNIHPANVHIADINFQAICSAQKKFGYTPVQIGPTGTMPFKDNSFDIVFCSSVIEHVTMSDDEAWACTSDKEFRRLSLEKQKSFANEIQRLGKQYFVQTPNKYFIIESHTFFPFLGYLPRKILVPFMRILNRFWFDTSEPSWHLLDKKDVALLFDKATIEEEKILGLTKSFMAIKKNSNKSGHAASG